MLHHVPSPGLQDQLLGEAFRVLQPGGIFAGADSTTSLGFRVLHIGDTMVTVDPSTFAGRLTNCGFEKIAIERSNKGAFRFRAWKPAE